MTGEKENHTRESERERIEKEREREIGVRGCRRDECGHKVSTRPLRGVSSHPLGDAASERRSNSIRLASTWLAG